jgi:shikimate kinase
MRAAVEAGAAAALSGAGPGLVAFSTSREVVSAAVGRMRAVFEAEAIETWGWEGGISARGAGRR